MDDYQNRSKDYLKKVFKLSKNQDLVNYAQQLLQDWQEFPGTIAQQDIQFALAKKSQLEIIDKMVQLAYNWRYCGNKAARLSKFNQQSVATNTKTFVAQAVSGKHKLILATTRLVRDQIELFIFFQPLAGHKWPHRKKNLVPYEFERLAFHPLFDLTKDRELQFFLLSGLCKFARTHIKESEYWLGCTMRPNVYQFAKSAGIKTKPISNLQFVRNDYTNYLVDLFPGYFQNFAAYEIK